ncbi:MAG TPA: hypothetical protein VMU80_27065 [Bryobacteraceae bacterium]|nr:hypothetical protein [Bryobacteraceae bacterium]HUO32905.1 hypothetical protein [Bryobacteraceae bacterium]
MTHKQRRMRAIALALAFPFAALADPSVTLTSGQELTVATGAVGTTGGDIQWTGSQLNMLNGAKAYQLPDGPYNVLYTVLTIQEAMAYQYSMSSNPLAGSGLVVDSLFVMETGAGAWAKFLVTANSGGSITFTYLDLSSASTSTGGANAPSITGVQNAASYSPNIAQGSIFIIKGSNLSASGSTSTTYPLPQSSDGVSIKFTPQSGGTATEAYIVYLYNENGTNQLAGLLPSTVTPGAYQVTVTTDSGTSSPANVQVVANNPGIVTQDSSGSGLAVVQNYVSASELDINRFTTGIVNGEYISPAHPGQTLILWLTGMAPLPSNIPDNTAPNDGKGYDFTKNGVSVQVFVGGMAITPFYGGRSPCCAGEDQIDFTLPDNVPTGCTTELHVTVNGHASQSTFISVAAKPGDAACTLPGYTTAQLEALDNGGSVTLGRFAVQQSLNSIPTGNENFDSVGGEFYQYSGFQLAGATNSNAGLASLPSGCVVTPIPAPPATVATGLGALLDAGNITLTGPAGSGLSAVKIPESKVNAYELNFSGAGTTVNGNFVPGTYTLAGSGGKSVGPFNVSINVPTILTVANMPSSVTRSAGLTLNWTGGNSSDPVLISGDATNQVSGVQTGATFVCLTTAGAGSFTVPASILNQLPAVTSAALTGGTGVGGIDVVWYVGTFPVLGSAFSAPLTAGGSANSTFGAGSTTVAVVPFQ